MRTANGDLWEFSLTLYAEPGVAASCLSLQNQHGFDVNLVLFCIWYGFRYGDLTDDLLSNALNLSKCWREAVTQPLRSLRDRLTTNRNESVFSSSLEISDLRERIKSAELDAERIQQQELEKLILPIVTDGVDIVRGETPARRNLDSLAATRGTLNDVAIIEHFEAILLKVHCS